LGGPFFDDVGYDLSEFVISGTADAYTNVNELTPSGMWEVQVADSMDYTTRLVVFRPSDPGSFNGTVVVEWLNVSAGSDVASDWRLTHTELTRSGYAWIGVSAQARGVETLISSGDERYASLSHPGDSFSYSVFSQVAALLRSDQGEALLGPLNATAILAMGESQSASRLLTYVNALSLTDRMYDGYLIHSRYFSSAALSQSPQVEITPPDVVLVRDDIEVPVMMFQTESDVVALDSYLSRQDDTDLFRLWEAAGTAHADYYITITTNSDRGDDPNVAAVFEEALFCDKPINTGPQHFVTKAALVALNTWVVDGVPPVIADRITVNESIPEIVRDEFGNALGGIRTPFVDAPLATLSGEGNSSESFGFCNRLFGTTALLDANTIASRYADSAAYIAEVDASADSAVEEGFLLPADAELVKAYARQVDIFASPEN
ncbi:MAG: alpha/beta hydrolase domain-containing protein, partial [Halioglobus sp.]